MEPQAPTSATLPGTDASDRSPSFTRALLVGVTGLALTLGLILLAALVWRAVASTEASAREEISDVLDRSAERLQILMRAAELTAASVRRVSLAPEVTGARLRPTLESLLTAFEQRPELSYIGIALAGAGEYGTLERTAGGTILLWLFPGTRSEDPVTRTYQLTDAGFVLRDEHPTDGYDPRDRPFYRAALDSPGGDTWMPVYRWIVHSDKSEELWGLTYVQALRAPDGHVIGVLDTDLDLPALNQFVAQLDAEYHSGLQVVELGPTPQLIGGAQVGHAPLPVPAALASLLEPGRDFVRRVHREGERRWVAARRVELQGVSWMVVATRPAPLIAPALRRQLLQLAGMGLAILAALVLVSVRMAHLFGRPLTELQQRVASLERGEPPATTAPREGFRETRLLGAAFDTMADTVRQREHELSVQNQALQIAQQRLLGFNAELEQRVAERTLELRNLNRELESFSYSVSHDLRAPLRGIAGFTGILARDYGAGLDEAGRGHLDRVQAATQRMNELIEDLLELSRVSRGELRRESVDLSGLAREVLANLQQGAPERRVDTQVEDGLVATGDRRLLRILLENLLGNAWKFTANTPEARIRFAAAGVEDGMPAFAVADNGAGFDMRYAGKLFGPFQRLHQASEYPGTGIGLATVQRIVNRHGGRIRAAAEPGKGATFLFTLGQAHA